MKNLSKIMVAAIVEFMTICLMITWYGAYSEGLVLAEGDSIDTSVTPHIVCGISHSLFLKSDGTVWAWGSNAYGKLGNGAYVDSDDPHARSARNNFLGQIKGLTGVKAIAAGSGHSLALKKDGTVWAWGGNISGELGEDTFDGTPHNEVSPVRVDNLTDVTAISAGSGYSLALKRDGTVWSWGNNRFGQLGNGTSGELAECGIPKKVGNLTDVIEISAGEDHCLALRRDGTVWTWGNNLSGQLGNGTYGKSSNSNVPIKVGNLTGVTTIDAGSYNSLAVKKDGTVWEWGCNSYRQMNNIISGKSPGGIIPLQVKELNGVTSVAAGTSHSLALKKDGTVWAWGENISGQLGNGVFDRHDPAYDDFPDIHAPAQVKKLAGITEIDAGWGYSIALKNDGTVWAWGSNDYGQLGNGLSGSFANDDSSVPIKVAEKRIEVAKKKVEHNGQMEEIIITSGLIGILLVSIVVALYRKTRC